MDAWDLAMLMCRNQRLALYVRCAYDEKMSETLKDARWNLRVAAEANDLVRQAASVRHQNLTAFVLEAAVGEAERVLADRSSFVLGEAQWHEFVDLLDRPVRDNPGLVRLFSKPTAFE